MLPRTRATVANAKHPAMLQFMLRLATSHNLRFLSYNKKWNQIAKLSKLLAKMPNWNSGRENETRLNAFENSLNISFILWPCEGSGTMCTNWHILTLLICSSKLVRKEFPIYTSGWAASDSFGVVLLSNVLFPFSSVFISTISWGEYLTLKLLNAPLYSSANL